MDFVISARVHTNMLSMVSHTTIIPIEASDFRLAELLEGFEYPHLSSKRTSRIWVEEVIAMVDQIMQDNSVVDNYYNNRFQEPEKHWIMPFG